MWYNEVVCSFAYIIVLKKRDGSMNNLYSLGIDVGSTTVKTVILDGDNIIYNKYVIINIIEVVLDESNHIIDKQCKK